MADFKGSLSGGPLAIGHWGTYGERPLSLVLDGRAGASDSAFMASHRCAGSIKMIRTANVARASATSRPGSKARSRCPDHDRAGARGPRRRRHRCDGASTVLGRMGDPSETAAVAAFPASSDSSRRSRAPPSSSWPPCASSEPCLAWLSGPPTIRRIWSIPMTTWTLMIRTRRTGIRGPNAAMRIPS